MTVKGVIDDVCRQANMNAPNACYLWFDSRELTIDNTVFETGLYQTPNVKQDLPEVRLRYVEILKTSGHVGKQVFLASPEKLAYNEILNISQPCTKENIIPHALKEIAVQMVQNESSIDQPVQQYDTVLIPLPNFSKQSIDSLPTITLTIPLPPNQFDWNVFLECLAVDLEIEQTDLVIVNAHEGSTILKMKLAPRLSEHPDMVKKVADKLLVMVLPKCETFVTKHLPRYASKVDRIKIELENFAGREITRSENRLSLDEIELALRFSKRPAIVNGTGWDFLIKKSRQISTIIIQAIQSCSDEYFIDHALIVYNEQIYEKYENLAINHKAEKILFHGTNIINFDGIFEHNFQYNSGVKRTDDGWYGQGIYFSNSPKKALNYSKSGLKIHYLICSLVQLGQTLTVTDMSYKGKPIHHNYDSHYVPIRIDGEPVSQGEAPAFEEFVVKKSEQIMPLYIIGMSKVSCFAIWRDAKITDEANASLFENMKQKYACNIYGSQTSTEALNILKHKLISNEFMNCVVITNGADDGEGFVRQCRVIRSSLPIIVYCKNKTYHQQWAATFSEPKINVTTSPEEVFNLMNNILQE